MRSIMYLMEIITNEINLSSNLHQFVLPIYTVISNFRSSFLKSKISIKQLGLQLLGHIAQFKNRLEDVALK